MTISVANRKQAMGNLLDGTKYGCVIGLVRCTRVTIDRQWRLYYILPLIILAYKYSDNLLYENNVTDLPANCFRRITQQNIYAATTSYKSKCVWSKADRNATQCPLSLYLCTWFTSHYFPTQIQYYLISILHTRFGSFRERLNKILESGLDS